MEAKKTNKHAGDFYFSFITVGQIVKELKDEGIYKFARSTFYRLEDKIKDFPKGTRTIGDWRSYTREEADEIKRLIKKAYGFRE